VTRLNMDTISDAIQGDVLAPGVYKFRIAKVTVGETKNGDEMWTLELKEVGGDSMVWDRLVFIKAALPRIKMLYKQVGLPVEGTIDCTPADIMDMSLYAEIQVVKYNNEDQNKVTFGGYHHSHVPEGATSGEKDGKDESLPF